MIINFISTSGFSSVLLQFWHILFAIVLVGFAFAMNPQLEASLCFSKQMKQLKTRQATALAIWAGMNLICGGLLMFITEGERLYYFCLMNICWGLVNLGVAMFLYFHHNEVFKQPISLLQQMDYQRHVEKMIMLNIGLDLAFIASGLALQRHGHISGIAYSAFWKGGGTSVIMQGAFLLGQDIIFYRLHLKNRRRVYPFWKQKAGNRF